MPLGSLATVVATLGAILGNRTYGSRLRLLVDYLRIGAAYARARWTASEVTVARCAGFRVFYRHARSLYTTFKEVFIEEDYYFEDLPERPYIVDCGANIGMATLFFRRLRPQAEIMAIEPSPSSLELLTRNLAENHVEGVRIVEAALSDRDGTAAFLEEYPSGVSSRLNDEGRGTVQTLRVSGLLDRPVDLLKVDVEGPEVIVLEELERSGKFGLVARVVVECGLHTTPDPDVLSRLLAVFERNDFRYAIDARSSRPLDASQSVTVRAWRCGPGP